MPDPSASTSASASASVRQQSSITDHFIPHSPTVPTSSKRSKMNFPETPTKKTAFKKESMTPVSKAAMMEFGAKDSPFDLTSSPIGSPAPRPSSAAPARQPPALGNAPVPPRPGVVKLQIKNLKTLKKKSGDSYLVRTWNLLDEALTVIFKRSEISMSREALYRGVEGVCREGKAPELYGLLKSRCDEYVEKQLRPSILKEVGEDDVEAVRIVVRAWAGISIRNSHNQQRV